MIYVYTAVCIPLEVPCDMANTGTKDKKKQLNSKVFANSSRVRCGARFTRATPQSASTASHRAFERKKPFVKIPSRDKVMGLAEHRNPHLQRPTI